MPKILKNAARIVNINNVILDNNIKQASVAEWLRSLASKSMQVCDRGSNPRLCFGH